MKQLVQCFRRHSFRFRKSEECPQEEEYCKDGGRKCSLAFEVPFCRVEHVGRDGNVDNRQEVIHVATQGNRLISQFGSAHFSSNSIRNWANRNAWDDVSFSAFLAGDILLP